MILAWIPVQEHAHWNGIILFNSIIFLHVVISELLFHLMCIHEHEWISNLLSFFSLVFTGRVLRPTETVHATLGDFHSTWTTREPCRFLPSECILMATNLKDIRMSLILENKILKKETLKTTRKSSLHLIPCEQRFHLRRLVLRCLEQYPALRQEIRMHSPPLDLAQTDFHLKYDNFPRYRWLHMTSTTDDKIFLSRLRFMFMPKYGIACNETPDNNNNKRAQCKLGG